jgi:2-polyprenyl-6-hydroxyphenyl methylase/3-demethylubiquinone-9 3-methyltransferase
MQTTRSTAIDRSEVAKFSDLAPSWWDPAGPMAPLHALNAARVRYVRDAVAAHFGRDAAGKAALAGLRLLDLGCGAGLLAEPLARLGATVTGLDASAEAIAAAKEHAAGSGLAIDYRVGTADSLDAEKFDAVLAMEVVEHVPDVDAFVAEAVAHLKADGLLIAATINRTPKSFALAIVGAEYILRWLPRGTHDWSRFVRPSELSRALRKTGLRVRDVSGATFDAATATFALSRDVDVNYLVSAAR